MTISDLFPVTKCVNHAVFHKIVVLSLELALVKCNYQNYALKGVACVVLSGLASNSAVIGPSPTSPLG